MKISKFLLLLIFAGCFQLPLFAQGKLVYINGKEKRFSSAELKGEFIVYRPETAGSDKSSIRKADKYNIFSIKRDDGSEEVIYNPDTTYGEDPSIEEVRDYIKGEKYAALVYHEPVNFVTGMQIGFTSGLLLPAFYALAAPVIYPGIIGRFVPAVKTPLVYRYDAEKDAFTPLPEGTDTKETVVSEAFAAGYGKKARNMKMKSSLIGGAIGFGFSITALVLILGK